MATKVQCVAVLGKRNNPLYLRVFKHYEEKLKCHYVVHTSLDVVDERTARSDKQGYLGVLLTNEDSKVYGYITCTQIKFIAVLDEVGAKEDNAKKFFERLHECYINAVSNPFYVHDKKIVSQAFDRAVTSACHRFFGQ